MRLLHLSDTHLHVPGASTHHPEIDAAGRLETVLAAARRHGRVDAIALTGDICDDGSVIGAEAVRERLHAAYPDVPVLAVPGNHDLSESIRTVFGPLPEELDGWLVRGAETNELGRIEGLAGPAVAALGAVADDEAPLLLLQHHPLRSRSTHAWFTLVDADALATALEQRRGPVVLLTGHTHQAYERRDGHIHHVGAPSTYYAITHDGQDWAFAPDGTGAQIVELSGDAVAAITPVRA